VHDLDATVRRLRLAADNGSRDAAFHLGRLTMEGKIDPGSPIQNAANARKLLKAAWSGDGLSPECLSAAVVLSVLDYAESRIGIANTSRRDELAASARNWAQNAYYTSLPRASFLWGRMLIEGVGGAASPIEGQRQLLLAAQEGMKVTLPPPATAAAQYGVGNITGMGPNWTLELRAPKRGEGLSYSIFGTGPSPRASVSTNMIFTNGQTIRLSVNAKPGEEIDVWGRGQGRFCLITVPAPTWKPSGYVPELDHFVQKYFPGSSITPPAPAR